MGWWDKLTYRIGPPETVLQAPGWREFIDELIAHRQGPPTSLPQFVFVYRGQKLLLTLPLKHLIDLYKVETQVVVEPWRFAHWATRYIRRTINNEFRERTQQEKKIIAQRRGRPTNRTWRKRKRQRL